MLYVDCQNQSTLEFLEPRGPIDINGVISVSKLSDSRETVPVSKLYSGENDNVYFPDTNLLQLRFEPWTFGLPGQRSWVRTPAGTNYQLINYLKNLGNRK